MAEDGEFLVFVEVKMREFLSYGEPEFSITKSKQRHIVKSALQYIKQHGRRDRTVRFDVVVVTPERMELIKDAFRPAFWFTL